MSACPWDQVGGDLQVCVSYALSPHIGQAGGSGSLDYKEGDAAGTEWRVVWELGVS